MLDLMKDLPKTKQETNQHLRLLTRMTMSKRNKPIFDHLYDCLSILDSKSSFLLTFNSLVLVVYTISFDKHFKIDNHILGIPLLLGAICSVISSFFLLKIVWVDWSATTSLSNLSDHAFELLSVRKQRTIHYRLAWHLSRISLVILSIFLIFIFLMMLDSTKSISAGSNLSYLKS